MEQDESWRLQAVHRWEKLVSSHQMSHRGINVITQGPMESGGLWGGNPVDDNQKESQVVIFLAQKYK